MCVGDRFNKILRFCSRFYRVSSKSYHVARISAAKENTVNRTSANEFHGEAGYKLLPVDRLLMRIAFYITLFARLHDHEVQTNLSRKCTRFARYINTNR